MGVFLFTLALTIFIVVIVGGNNEEDDLDGLLIIPQAGTALALILIGSGTIWALGEE